MRNLKRTTNINIKVLASFDGGYPTNITNYQKWYSALLRAYLFQTLSGLLSFGHARAHRARVLATATASLLLCVIANFGFFYWQFLREGGGERNGKRGTKEQEKTEFLDFERGTPLHIVWVAYWFILSIYIVLIFYISLGLYGRVPCTIYSRGGVHRSYVCIATAAVHVLLRQVEGRRQ